MVKIIEQVKKFFKEEWENASPEVNRAFKGHFKAVLKYALMLAEKENADKEIVEISAWLHDISSIRGDYEDHHVKGAKIAEELLKN